MNLSWFLILGSSQRHKKSVTITDYASFNESASTYLQ